MNFKHYNESEAIEIIKEYATEQGINVEFDTLCDEGERIGRWCVCVENDSVLYLYDDPELWIEVR